MAEGPVRLVTGAQDAARLQEGDVLVTKITDPTMVSRGVSARSVAGVERKTARHACRAGTGDAAPFWLGGVFRDLLRFRVSLPTTGGFEPDHAAHAEGDIAGILPEGDHIPEDLDRGERLVEDLAGA